MARSFTTRDIKRLLKEHQNILSRLRNVENMPEQYREEITKAADSLIAQEVIKILKEIPVEEINRYRRGFRVKTLREYGFTTIADLYDSSVYDIATVQGISDDGAYAIKYVVSELAEQASKGVKVRLSIDDKSPATTELITAIAKYKNILSHIETCQRCLSENSQRVQYAMEDVVDFQRGFRWIFSSKIKKQKAQDAYQFLKDLMDGEYGQYTKSALHELDYIQTFSEEKSWEEFSRDSIRFFNILEDIYPGLLGTDDTVYGLPEDLAHKIQEEIIAQDGLLCELRRYQEWGVKYILRQERVLLGDEMGLGKTIQAIATMVSLKNTGATHFIVICPASVIENWCREIRKHSRLSVIKVHGHGKMLAFHSWIESGGVAVTTYETTGHFKFDDSFKFSILVVDEAHYIKNPEAKRSRNVKRIANYTERMLFMTGTALENRVNEMIELINILQPDVARQVQGITSLSSALEFRKKVAPVYYRRKREDVLTELPELIENEEWCTLGEEELKMYRSSLFSQNFNNIRRVSWNIEDIRNSSKANRMLEIIKEAESEGRKVIVFSFFLDTIRKISLLLGTKCTEPINGSVSPKRRQEIIDEFNKAPAGTVLLSQIQAGGTGLNIQSASVVILCEPQLKPSIESQAISRAYRMGQTRNVLVYRLLCEDTVDKKLMDILAEKQMDFDNFADKSEAAKQSLEINEKTFGNIVKEEINRINEINKEKQILEVRR